ncbi:DUF1206 domain-containing protein [Raineyella fluvialis]|nr:DUF1206 domain-containing protein [Raineyella fluvialis]
MTAQDGARKAADNPVVENGARAGFAASGVLHLLMAWLALRLAWGQYHGEADQSGAFQALASTTAGVILLGVLAAGLFLLGLWNLLQAFLARHELKDALRFASLTVVYAVLGVGAALVATGGQSSSSQRSKDITAAMMGNAAGTVLVVVVGLVVVIIGGFHIYKGVTGKYRDDLRHQPSSAVVLVAILGYVAKGVALLVVGALFWVAVATHDPQKASGMDGALRALLGLPLGRLLLSVVALGLVAYGIYAFTRAKHRELP